MKTNITHIFETIYENESDTIFRFCVTRVSDREQALDITQEVFVRLWQTLCRGEKVLNNKAFLFKITRNLIVDWYRKKKSVSLEGMMAHNEGIESFVIDEASFDNLEVGPEGRFLIDKINDLSPTSRDPVYLRFVEGLSPQEIADILGVSANTASVRISRGLIELRKKTGYIITDNKNE